MVRGAPPFPTTWSRAPHLLPQGKAAGIQRPRVHRRMRFGALVTAGDDEVVPRNRSRADKLPLKAAGFESRGEALESLSPDRLGTIEGDLPTAQIKLGLLLRRDLANT